MPILYFKYIFLFVITVASYVEIQGDMEKGYFHLPIGVGEKEDGSVPFQFSLLLDIASSATMIPDTSCASCKDGNKYDSTLSTTYDPIGCSSDFCKTTTEDVCPATYSKDGKCCDVNNKGLCMWDNSIQYDTVYSATGGIIRDTISVHNISAPSYIVNVFKSEFTALPEKTHGILGISEESCNPTCIPPFYHSVLQAENPSYKKEDMMLSLCFGQTTGQLGIGEDASLFATSSPIFAYQRPGEIGYTFDLMDLMLNNRSFTGMTSMGLNRVVLLESTFNEIRLPEDLYNLFKDEMKENYDYLDGVADGTIFDDKGITHIQNYPTFDVKLPGAVLHLPPQLYFIKRDIVGLEQYFLHIKPNKFSNTVQLGLAALRGYAIQIEYDSVGFSPVNTTLCGDATEDVVGWVEWAPSEDDTDLDHPIMILMLAFCVVGLGAVLVLMRSQSRKKKIPMRRPDYEPTPTAPFRDTQESLIAQSV